MSSILFSRMLLFVFLLSHGSRRDCLLYCQADCRTSLSSAMLDMDDSSSTHHLEKQLDAIHEVQDEIDTFVHRIGGIKEKLNGFEQFVQGQFDEERFRTVSHRDSRGSRGSDLPTNQTTEENTNQPRDRSGTVEDMKQLQEPVALTEHREKKWESTVGWYWPLGTVSSLTQTSNFLGTGKELRLHNRWMQLSMQAEALIALSEYRRTGTSNRYSKHVTSGLSEHLDNAGVSVFHPLGRIRVIWDLCGLVLLLADAILLPLSLAWDWHQGTKDAGSLFLLVVFLLSLVFWSCDIMMNLNTAFYQRGYLVLSRWEIFKHYMQTWYLDCRRLVPCRHQQASTSILDQNSAGSGFIVTSNNLIFNHIQPQQVRIAHHIDYCRSCVARPYLLYSLEA